MLDPSSILYLTAALLFLALVYLVAVYNKIARLRNVVRESWSDVDVALKRRYDLIPNLVATVKAYASHEEALLTQIAAARERAVVAEGSIDMKQDEERKLVGNVNILLGHVEAYPELKSSSQYLDLQHELINSEDRIAASRRFYNANVRDFNTLLTRFPTGLVAKANGFAEAPFFDVEGLDVRVAPSVNV